MPGPDIGRQLRPRHRPSKRHVDGFIQDLQFALRLLWKERGFSATVVITLAICIGANVGLVSRREQRAAAAAADARVGPNRHPSAIRIPRRGRRISVRIPSRITSIGSARPRCSRSRRSTRTPASTSISTARPPGSGHERHASFFRLLRVRPALGRTFTAEEGEIGSNQRLVLSYGLLAVGLRRQCRHRRAGHPPRRADPTPWSGVMPQDFIFQRPDVMLWRALRFTPLQKSDETRHSNSFQQIGRLKNGATPRTRPGGDRRP